MSRQMKIGDLVGNKKGKKFWFYSLTKVNYISV